MPIVSIYVPRTDQTFEFDTDHYPELTIKAIEHGWKQKLVDKLAGKDVSDQRAAEIVEDHFYNILANGWNTRASGMSAGLKGFRDTIFGMVQLKSITQLGSTWDSVTDEAIVNGVSEQTVLRIREAYKALDTELKA